MSPLDSRLERTITLLVRSQLGENAHWQLHERSAGGPMSFVLDEAAKRLGSEVVVVWVDGGYPQLSTFTGLKVPVVLYSTRYVELTAYLRGLLVEEWLADRRVEQAKRAFLTVLSEFALLARNPELAVRLFLRSKLGTAITRTYRDILPDLELIPISERYMAAWFFGLAHEFGHSDTPSLELTETGLLSAEALEGMLRAKLGEFDFATEVDLVEVLERIRAGAPGHPLGVEHLRGEAVADLFAAGVIFDATGAALRALVDPTQPVHPGHYVAEVYFYLNVIAALQRSKGAVRAASMRELTNEMERVLLEPAAVAVRLELLKTYLVFALAAHHSDNEVPANEEISEWLKLVEEVMASFSPAVSELDSGLGKAMEVAFWDREPLEHLLAQTATEHDDPLFKLDVRAFCELAPAGVEHESLAALAALAT
jgi:hypothetical protein